MFYVLVFILITKKCTVLPILKKNSEFGLRSFGHWIILFFCSNFKSQTLAARKILTIFLNFTRKG